MKIVPTERNPIKQNVLLFGLIRFNDSLNRIIARCIARNLIVGKFGLIRFNIPFCTFGLIKNALCSKAFIKLNCNGDYQKKHL